MDDSMAPEPTDTGEVPPEENASGTDIQAPEDRNPTDSKNPFPAELA
jgi:hypothetical protein